MNTKEINTLSLAPTDYDDSELHDHMVQFQALDTVRALIDARMRDFHLTENFEHYVRAQKLKQMLAEMLAREV